MDRENFPRLVNELYGIVRNLEAMFPGRHFTPDGHLVGSLGECLAAYHYGLELLPASTIGGDAQKAGLSIEIKATQRSAVGLRYQPEHLLVLQLDQMGGFKEVYNGPGDMVWKEFDGKTKPSNGQYRIALPRLSLLMEHIPRERRLRMVIPNK